MLEEIPLHTVVTAGHGAIAEKLQAKREAVCAPGPRGSIPLHVVAAKGDLDVLRLLLNRWTDPNQMVASMELPLWQQPLTAT